MKKRGSKRRLGVALLATVGALSLSIGIAVAEKPQSVTVGNLELTVNGGFSPKALSKKALTPIALTAEGKIRTLDGSHPPALKEFLLESDKNGAVNVKGFPVCKSGKLQSQTTKAARAACPDSIIGTGKTSVEITLDESKDVPVNSDLTVFNGGTKGGTTTFYIHAYITIPLPASIVTTVKIKKINKGRYGLLATASIPKIAGGAGSVTSFSLVVDEKFTYKGKKVSVLSAKCPDGKLQAKGTAIFTDGTRASAEIVRACTGKG